MKNSTGNPSTGAILLVMIFLLGFFSLQASPVMADPGANPAQPFKIRAFHVDLRIQVMKLGALKKLATQLHGQGINTIIMEWEGSYPFEQEAVISNQFAYTRSGIKEFIRYCHSLQMDVIPLQQSFGHVEYILKHYKYAALREDKKDFSQVCPTEIDKCRELFTKLMKDMADLHGSPYFHIGGDETFLLGHCEKCKRKVAEVGLSGLYFDYIKMICDIAVSLGKKPVLWADIAIHYPEKISLLPKQTVFIDWNYGWDFNNFGDHSQLLKSGYEIWGAPAIRSEPDNFYIERWGTHFRNIATFIPDMRRLNYTGSVMTSWSTSGAYSTVFDSNNDPVAIYPVRRVYPLSGFNLLIGAYTEALRSETPLDPSAFIRKYTKERYGFNETDSKQFEHALLLAPYAVINGKVEAEKQMPLSELVDSAATAWRELGNLKPTRNTIEFQHYVLMAGIRHFYLQTLLAEAQFNSPDYNRDAAARLLPTLSRLRQRSLQLDQQFAALNSDFLVPGEISLEKELRNAKLNSLYAQVQNNLPKKE